MTTEQITHVPDEAELQEEFHTATQAGVSASGKEYRAMSQETETAAQSSSLNVTPLKREKSTVFSRLVRTIRNPTLIHSVVSG